MNSNVCSSSQSVNMLPSALCSSPGPMASSFLMKKSLLTKEEALGYLLGMDDTVEVRPSSVEVSQIPKVQFNSFSITFKHTLVGTDKMHFVALSTCRVPRPGL